MSKYPSVYPSDVHYKPGRIQSLSSEQEIVLKQSWAALLKYWGYDVDISPQDIHSKNAFVPSSVTQLLKTSTTNISETSVKQLNKKKSFFSRKGPEVESPISVRRKKQIKNGHLETYGKCESVSESTRHIFLEHYKEGLHHQEDDFEEDVEDDGSDSSDTESIQTFYSASSSLATFTFYEELKVKANISEKTKLKAEENMSTQSASSGYKVKNHKDIFPFMRQYDPKTLHNSMMAFSRNDLMDNLLLRYIRARKYLLPDAIKMFTNSLDWKVNGYKVNELLLEGDAPSHVNGVNKGFVKNFSVGKSLIRGHDKNKNPLFLFQSRKHFAHDSPLPETERFALLIIEWCRLFLREVNESVDTCSVVFDLTGFSMKNGDNAPVKFLTAISEAHYPECLGIIIVHNAPWIFSTVWNIIKNWLDPGIASKIHFTKGFDELNKLVDAEYIPSYLGGKDDSGNAYDNPTEEHTRPPKAKDAKYRQLRKEREELHMKFIETTIKWVESTNSDVSSKYLRDKIYLSYELSDNYIALDPYIRNPGIYDRNGTLVLRN